MCVVEETGLKKLRDTKFQAWKLEALGHICPACYTSEWLQYRDLYLFAFTSPSPWNIQTPIPELGIASLGAWSTTLEPSDCWGKAHSHCSWSWTWAGSSGAHVLLNLLEEEATECPPTQENWHSFQWAGRKTLVNSNTRGNNKGTSLVTQMVKNPPAMQETRVRPVSREDPWRREWLPTLGFLPGEPHWQRSLAGYHPWAAKNWTRLSG